MTQLSRFTLGTLLAAAFLNASLSADVIAGFSPEGQGADYVGTFTGSPGTWGPYDSLTTSVAQLIHSSGDYANLSLQVELEDSDPGVIDFSIAPDDGGIPGAIIATSSVNLPGDRLTPFTSYALTFPGASIGAATYWLIASSPTVEDVDDVTAYGGPELPAWQNGPCGLTPGTVAPDGFGVDPVCNPAYNNTIEYQVVGLGPGGALSDPPWQAIDDTPFAFELDGVAVPEPRSTSFFLAFVFAIAVLARRFYCRRFSRRSMKVWGFIAESAIHGGEIHLYAGSTAAAGRGMQ